MTEEKKFRVIVGLRQPNRKIRMGNITEDELNRLGEAMASEQWTEIHGPTKAGSIVLIPASNVAYVEAVEL